MLPFAHLPSPLQLEIEGFVVQNVIKEMGRITAPSPNHPTTPYDNPSANQGFPLLAHANRYYSPTQVHTHACGALAVHVHRAYFEEHARLELVAFVASNVLRNLNL